MGEENGVNGNTKKIKFAKRSTSSSDNNLSNNSNNGNGNNFTTGNESVTSAMTFDKQSTATRIGGVSGLFGFLFSPAGIVLMFVAVNYPWLKTLIVGSSTSLFPSTTTASFSSSPSSSPMNTKSTSPSSAPTNSKKTGSNAKNKIDEADLLLQNLSPGCKNNPFKRIFDRTCREEIKLLRIARKFEKMKKRKERQERRKRRQQQQQLYPQTPANATVTAADDDTDFGSSNNGYHPTTTTRTITTSSSSHQSSQQIKIVNINTLECNNILSRECRQKKRLMQQMKEALN